MTANRTANLVLIVSIVLAIAGTVTAFTAFNERTAPGGATAMTLPLVMIAAALLVLGLALKMGAKRTPSP